MFVKKKAANLLKLSMTTNGRTHPQVVVKRCNEELQKAVAGSDQGRIAAAHANLGYALLNARKNDEGTFQFDLAIELAETVQNPELLRHCLAIKVLAFQTIGWLPDAYKTAGEILALAEAEDDQGMKCDALLSLGQIMLDSGEPFIALERYQKARDIALALNDKRRMMNVMGAFGNYALNVAETGKAREYFHEARLLARELGDKAAEIGYLGNEATMLAYHNHFVEADAAFRGVLAYTHENENRSAELQALQHLVQVNEKLDNQQALLTYGQRGIALATEIKEADQLFDFYQVYILACYEMNRIEEAEAATEQAVAAAQAGKNKDKEVDFLLSLGESAMNSEMPEKALEAYQQAKKGAVRLSRQKDEAYLTGRIGVALAEMGRTDEAIGYHEQAIDMAKRRELTQLEGEQLSMLAMAYLEKEQWEEAQTYCQSAIQVFTEAELEEDAKQAERLLADIG